MLQLQLNIPKPCHENWDNMSATQKGRFCNACAKEVVDFSSMTDAQVLHYFTSNFNDKICGRAYPDQLNRVIALPEKPKRKWYWQYAAAFFLFFTRSNESKAQGQLAARAVADTTPRVSCVKPADTSKIIRVGGMRGTLVEAAPLIIIDGIAGTEKELAAIAPNDIVSIDILKSSSSTALYGAAGAAGVMVVTTHKGAQAPAYRELDTVAVKAPVYTNLRSKKTETGDNMLMGAMLSGVTIRTRDSIRTYVNSIISPLKVYPDPVQRGAMVNISFAAKANAGYRLQVMNAAGGILLQQPINTISKAPVQQMQVDSRWAAGVYYVNLFDSNNKLINKGSFIVQ